MEKLELRHLAPYLSYGLVMKVNDGCGKLIGVGQHSLDITDPDSIDSGMFVSYDECKPLLLPLSDIVERNSQTKEFYFLEILEPVFVGFSPNNRRLWTHEIWHDEQPHLEIKNKFNAYSFVIDLINGDVDVYLEDSLHCTQNQREYFNNLLKHHFDVFGLIEKGLALNKLDTL